MKIKSIALATTLALSAVLPVGNAMAAGGTVTPDVVYVDGTTLHVEGHASSGTLAASVEVYLGEALIAGPENTSVDSSLVFSYDMTGSFDASKTYKVCTADFDGGTKTCEETKKLIKTVEVTVKPPKIGETVTVVNYTPDKEPSATSSADTYVVDTTYWDKDGTDSELFAGTFQANTDYFAVINVSAKDGYVFKTNPTIKIKGGGVLTLSELGPDNDSVALIVKIKANETGEVAASTTVAAGDTGSAPSATEDTSGIAKKNISLGVSAAVSATILYGTHLIIKRKATRK